MDQLLNHFIMHANALDHAQGQPFFGIVSSYNPATHSVKVLPQPQGDTTIISGWLPICTPTLGNGWGVVCPPAIGEQVVVIPDSGDPNHGIVLGSVFSGPSQPPKPEGSFTQNGEISLVHKTGANVKFNNDGSIDLVAKTADIRINSPTNVIVTVGDLSMTMTPDSVDLVAPAEVKLDTPAVRCTGNLAVDNAASGVFTTASGQVVTVQDGIITNIY